MPTVKGFINNSTPRKGKGKIMSTSYISISRIQLVGLLASIGHATPIGFSALIEVKARKTANPYATHGIYKLSRVWPFVGTSYGDAVNRQREREDNVDYFVAQCPKYEYVGGVLVQYKTTGTLCVACQFNSAVKQAAKPIYFVGQPNGNLQPIAKEDIAPFLPPTYQATNQGVERPIIWRTYGVDTIISLRHDGNLFVVNRNGLPESAYAFDSV